MRFYESLALVFFLFFACLGFMRRLSWTRRAKIVGIAAAGCSGIEVAASLASVHPEMGAVVRDWLPVLLIPMAYWQTGQFSASLNQDLQNRLQRFDQKHSPPLLPPKLTTILEIAYLFCYPFVPCGLVALYITGMSQFAPEFWNVVLPSAYFCYATFPFIQTLPPRAIENRTQAQSQGTRIRMLNLFVLRHVSIQANTFPSGHVAASLAIALELLRVIPRIGAMFFVVAVAIALGAFIGRYHFALDVLLGAAVAVAVFLIMNGF